MFRKRVKRKCPGPVRCQYTPAMHEKTQKDPVTCALPIPCRQGPPCQATFDTRAPLSRLRATHRRFETFKLSVAEALSVHRCFFSTCKDTQWTHRLLSRRRRPLAQQPRPRLDALHKKKKKKNIAHFTASSMAKQDAFLQLCTKHVPNLKRFKRNKTDLSMVVLLQLSTRKLQRPRFD